MILATYEYHNDKLCNRSNTLINDIKMACNNNVDIHYLTNWSCYSRCFNGYSK